MPRPPSRLSSSTLAGLLALLLLAAGSVGAEQANGETGEAGERPASVGVTSIELEPGLPGTLSRLRVTLENRSASTLAAWAFDLHLDGEPVDGYEDLLLLSPAAPGETITLELHRLRVPRRAKALRLEVVEAWKARAEADGSWRLLEPVEGPRGQRQLELAKRE